jgi:serine/threonine protein kinase
LREVMDDPDCDKVYLVTDYMQKGPLMKVNSDGQAGTPFPPQRALRYLVQAAKGLQHLHERGILHSDLKPENMLVDAEDQVVLADFGVSALMGESGNLQKVGTPPYWAPEIIEGSGAEYGQAADVWALGISLYCMHQGRLPFYNHDLSALLASIASDSVTFSVAVPPLVESLTRAMLNRVPDKRITLSTLLRRLRKHVIPSVAGSSLLAVRQLSALAHDHQTDPEEMYNFDMEGSVRSGMSPGRLTSRLYVPRMATARPTSSLTSNSNRLL